MMNDNEKAAIAAGQWRPGLITQHGAHLENDEIVWDWVEEEPAPDMHLPENLWRALGKRYLSIRWNGKWWEVNFGILHLKNGDSVTESVFGALVALYDAEHPNA